MEDLTAISPQPQNLAARMDAEGSIPKRARAHTGSTPAGTKQRKPAAKDQPTSKRPIVDSRNAAGHEPVHNPRDRDLGKKPTTHDGSTFRIAKKPEYQRASTIELPMGSMPGPNAAEVPTPEAAVPLKDRPAQKTTPPAKKPTPAQRAKIAAEKTAAEVRTEGHSPTANRKRLDYLIRRQEAQQHEMALLTAQLEEDQTLEGGGDEKENQAESPPKAKAKAPRPPAKEPKAQPMQVASHFTRRGGALLLLTLLALSPLNLLVPCAQAMKFSVSNVSDRGMRTNLDNIRAAISARLPESELAGLVMIFPEGQVGPFQGHINQSAGKLLLQSKKIFPLTVPVGKGTVHVPTAIPFTVMVPHADTARSDNKGALENVQTLGWMLLSVPTKAAVQFVLVRISMLQRKPAASEPAPSRDVPPSFPSCASRSDAKAGLGPHSVAARWPTCLASSNQDRSPQYLGGVAVVRARARCACVRVRRTRPGNTTGHVPLGGTCFSSDRCPPVRWPPPSAPTPPGPCSCRIVRTAGLGVPRQRPSQSSTGSPG